MKELTPAQAEALFPELFKIARKLRAKGVEVRLHSFRVGVADDGSGGEPVKIVGVAGSAVGT